MNLKEALLELKNYKLALDRTSAVAVTDLAGIITYANNQFCKLSKYSREELIGQDHRIINSGLHSKKFFKNLWKTISSGKIWRGEMRNQAKDGTYYWVDTTIVPFTNSKGKPLRYIAIRTDITDRKNLEEFKEAERSRKENLARLAAVGEAIAEIGHEIRNPLSVILLKAQKMKRNARAGTLSTEAILKAASDIEQVCKRIDNLISSIRGLARDGTRDPLERIELFDLLKQLEELVKARMIRHRIAFDINAPKNIRIYCRPIQILQLLVNLLNNAADAIKKLDDKWIVVQTRKHGQNLRITVTDSGKGIPKDLRGKIMEPFFTSKQESGGTGLGLSISKKIVESHHGKLWIDHHKPHTTFVIDLPLNRVRKRRSSYSPIRRG